MKTDIKWRSQLKRFCKLYRWSGDRAFVEILTSTEIPAGKTVEFSEILDAKTYDEISGKAYYFKAVIVGSEKTFTITHLGKV